MVEVSTSPGVWPPVGAESDTATQSSESSRGEKNRPVVVAAVLGAAGTVYLGKAIGYGFGSLAQPGVGFFPTIVGVVWIGASLAMLLAATRGSHAGRERAEEVQKPVLLRRVAVVAAGEVGFILLSPVVGFLLAGVGMSMLLLVGEGEVRLSRIVLTGAVAATMTFTVLSLLLGLPLSGLL